MIGTGLRIAMFGQENQRAEICALRKAVHTLTAAMATSTAAVSQRACHRAQSCSVPSALITSQVAPSKA